MSDSLPPVVEAVSPTGTPLIPPKYAPLLAVIPAIVVAIAKCVPPGTLFAQWAPTLATALAGFLGVASPGLRRAP